MLPTTIQASVVSEGSLPDLRTENGKSLLHLACEGGPRAVLEDTPKLIEHNPF